MQLFKQNVKVFVITSVTAAISSVLVVYTSMLLTNQVTVY